MCKIGARNLDPIVGFWVDSYEVARDEHLTTEHFSFRSTILGIAMLVFKLNWTEIKDCFHKIFSEKWYIVLSEIPPSLKVEFF